MGGGGEADKNNLKVWQNKKQKTPHTKIRVRETDRGTHLGESETMGFNEINPDMCPEKEGSLPVNPEAPALGRLEWMVQEPSENEQ